MKKCIKIVLLFSIVVTSFNLIQCQQKHPENIVIIARVGEKYLTHSDLEDLTPNSLMGKDKKDFQKDFVKEWINQKILSSYFSKNKISLNKADEAMLKNYEFQLLHTHFLNSIAAEVPKPTDVEISNYYEKHKNEFKRDEDEVHLVMLYLEQTDIGIRDDILHSSSLLEVISKNFLTNKINNQMEKNGDLGYVPISKLKRKILYAVKKYKKGKISNRIKTKDGYYYIQVLDYQKKGTFLELSLVKDVIIHRLSKQKFSKFVEEVIENESQNLIIDRFFENIN